MERLLRPAEKVSLALRSLYEQYGYRKYPMSKFEEYDFYTKNKDFLVSQDIIAFTDLNGKLMALKPDVTLSIVKNTRADKEGCEKLYYTENVYRVARGCREYKEIYQIGLEFVGQVTPYINVETVNLALKSLALIREDYVLDLSHMGYLTGFLDSLPVSADTKKAVLVCLEEKNCHELKKLTEEQNLNKKEAKSLLTLADLAGPFPETLARARELADNPAMEGAVAELESLYRALAGLKEAGHLRLDFSLSSDAKYYYGLMLRGYVTGVPRAVLSGGRYDPLLRRLGKDRLEAIGFAIYFDELERYLKRPVKDVRDLAVLYDENSDLTLLSRTVEEAVAQGLNVRALTHLPDGFAARRILRIKGNRLEEVECHD